MSSDIDRHSYWLPSAGADLMTHAHLPRSAKCTAAVLICGSIGYEATHSYRCMVRLADELAANGVAAFRFDYSGTGNSTLDASYDRLVNRWQENIADQVNHLRSEWGFADVSLVGFRFGAVLMTSILSTLDIGKITLWEPVARGKSFVREIRAAAQFSKDPTIGSDEALESGGFVYTDQTIDAIHALSLDSRNFGADTATLLVSRGANAKLNANATTLGFELEELRSREFDKMICEPHYTKLPLESIGRIAQWHSVQQHDTHDSHRVPELRTEATFRNSERDVSIRETIFRSDGANLFGVISQPEEQNSASQMTVVLPNAGSVCNIGPNRIYVQIARALATSGINVVRFDLRNLGESVIGDVAEANLPYPESATHDVAIMLEFLRTEFGLGAFTLAGLCSGSHAAYHYGLSTSDANVRDLILINPLTYYWKPGTSLSNPLQHRTVRSAKTYVRSARSARNWRRLLTGKINYRRLVWFSTKLLLRFLSNSLRKVSALWSHVPLTRMDQDLLSLEERGLRVAYIFSDTDPGYWIAKVASPRAFKSHLDTGVSTVDFIEDADHTMSKASNRDELILKLRKYFESSTAS